MYDHSRCDQMRRRFTQIHEQLNTNANEKAAEAIAELIQEQAG